MLSSRFAPPPLLLLLLLTLVVGNLSWAVPIGVEISELQTTTNSPALIHHDGANYLNSELEFEALLARLKKEAEESVLENPSNYVPDDIEIEELMRLIESSTDQVETANPSGTTGEPAAAAAALATGITTTVDATTASSWEPTVSPRVARPIATTPAEVATSTAESDDCPICLESIEKPGLYVTELGCKHRFHTDCLQTWIAKCPYIDRCPCCRRRLSHRSD